eukprot:6486307-Amphidinium_carterae.1
MFEGFGFLIATGTCPVQVFADDGLWGLRLMGAAAADNSCSFNECSFNGIDCVHVRQIGILVDTPDETCAPLSHNITYAQSHRFVDLQVARLVKGAASEKWATNLTSLHDVDHESLARCFSLTL